MVKIVPLNRLKDLANVAADDLLPKFDLAQCETQRCDAHLVKLLDGRVVARCSLWWTETPALGEEQLGVIGHYSVIDAASGKELLEVAGKELASRGCSRAVGPMDGNTWRRYRWVTERGDEPAFFLEPENPADWPEHWKSAGFTVLAAYFSALNTDLNHEDRQVARAGERLTKDGIRMRPLNVERLEDELRIIYAVSAKSFTQNFLYTPISEA